jgi:ABC-type phosphate transport system auxiliary subunit
VTDQTEPHSELRRQSAHAEQQIESVNQQMRAIRADEHRIAQAGKAGVSLEIDSVAADRMRRTGDLIKRHGELSATIAGLRTQLGAAL